MDNIHDQQFEQVGESRLQLENIRNKLIEGMLELSEAKKLYNSNQKELVEKELGLSKLVDHNQKLKLSLMKTLIEKEKLVSKKSALSTNICELKQHIENLESVSSLTLISDRVKSFCDRNSTANQRDILNKIADAKCKLMEYGFSSYTSSE